MLLTVVSFIGVLAVLVVVHELGHFLTAKAFGVKVLEFGIGYPPRLFGIRRGETLYSLNLLPLGGFVKMEGEVAPDSPRSLASKGTGTRFVVMAAGAFMNALLPILIFSVLFMVPQRTLAGDVQVQAVAPDSPAQRAGFQVGDRILRVDGRAIENNLDLSYLIMLNLGAQTTFQVQRSDGTHTLYAVPRWKPPEGQGATGITVETLNLHEVSHRYPPWVAVPKAFQKLGDVLVLAKNEITRWITGASRVQMAGPLGIAQMTGEVARAGGIVPLLEFIALLSINLAIFNILPIPMLDGGRITFVVIEWVRRGKRIPPEREGLVHMIGFALLIALAVVITYFDLLRIVRGESFLR